MTNVQRARQALGALRAAGVQTLVICPGGRNAPLVLAATTAADAEVLSFYDERSAAFFALGRVKQSGAPVAVITTSGTAVAELLPAVVEAHYGALPLVLLSADRPAALRGSGAPQTIEQVGLLGPYVERCLDLDANHPVSLAGWSRRAPLHINMQFDEPLLDDDAAFYDGAGLDDDDPPLGVDAAAEEQVSETRAALADFFNKVNKPLVLLGPVPAPQRQALRARLLELGAPVYAEALSGLRGDPALAELELTGGERSVAAALAAGACDGLLRLGGVPTLRAWRDLDATFGHVEVLHLSQGPFRGLTRGSRLPLSAALSLDFRAWRDDENWHTWRARDRHRGQKIAALLDAQPRSEPALLRALSRRLDERALLYLGNSLPVREWDLAAERGRGPARVQGNRGANGIDGQLSTFLGLCQAGRHNWAVVGDLTALYDMGAFWARRHLLDVSFTVVVVHNRGGRIFDRIFAEPAFVNAHDLDFEHLARLWGLGFERWERVPEGPPPEGQRLVELRPQALQTHDFWRAYDALDA